MTLGEIRAGTKEEAVQTLVAKSLSPMLVEEKRVMVRAAQAPQKFSFEGRIPNIDKILLTRHLSVILQAGIGLAEALEIVIGDVKHVMLRNILLEARQSVEAGEQLSTVLSRYPVHFSPVFIGMVRAGELSGTLDAALENVSGQLFRDYDMVKRVRSAMVYPAILMVGSAGVITLMMTFVLPRMTKAFAGAFAELPAITKFLISISNVLARNPYITVGVLVAIIVGIFVFLRSAFGARVGFMALQRIPVSSDLIKKLALARFSRTLRNLLMSGVGAVEAIELCAATVGNPSYQRSLMHAVGNLKKGANLSDTFKLDRDLYPNFFSSIMLVGERTGTLEKSLKTLSDFYEEEVDRVLRNLVSLVEPLLIFIMGIVVAFVALAVLLPIFKIVRSFQ